MKSFAKAMLAAVAAVALSAGSAQAAVIIDFGTGFAGPGGIIDIGANITGSGILIDVMTVSGSPASDGVYDVNGPAPCPSGGSGSCGILSFDKNANSIMLIGSILGAFPGDIVLLSGDLSGGITLLVNNGVTAAVNASGRDTKARALLIALGLDSAMQFSYFGFTTAVNPTGQGSPYTAISTEITNTSVPEPGSIALLGTGLVGLAGAARRRFRRKIASSQDLPA